MKSHRDEALPSRLAPAERNSENSPARFPEVKKTAGNYAFEVDLKGGFVFLSKRAQQLLGYVPDELVGKRSFFDLLASPGDAALVRKRFEESGADRRDIKTQCVTKEGRILSLSISAMPVVDEQKCVVGYRTVFEEIADGKSTEKAQSIIAEIGRIIGSSLKIDEVYERFAQQTRKLFPFDRLSVSLVCQETGELQIAYVTGTDIPGRHPKTCVPIAGSLPEEILRTRTGVVVNPANIEDLIRRHPTTQDSYKVGIRSLMAVPLISRGEIIGSLGFGSKTPNTYTNFDLALAQQIGDQIAGAMANAELYADLKRGDEEKTLIAEMGRIIGSSLNIDEVYERFSNLTSELIPFDRLSVSMIHGEPGERRIAYVAGTALPGSDPRSSGPIVMGTLIWEIMQTKTGLITDETRLKELGERHASPFRGYDSGIRSLVVVPLVSRGEIIGTLGFGSKKPKAYTSRDLSLAQRIGDQIAGAMANADLYADLKKEEQEKAVIAEIGRIISSSLDIHEVYERFAEQARKLIFFDRLSVSMIDIDSGKLRIAYVNGVTVPGRDTTTSFPAAGSLTWAIARTRTGIIFNPTSIEELEKNYPTAVNSYMAGIRSVLTVPLFSRGTVIGSLNFRSMTPGVYTNRDLSLAQRIGDQIAGAIANAELYGDLKRAEQENAVIAEIGRIISSSLDIDEVYELFSREAKKLIDFDRLAVALNDVAAGLVRVAYAHEIGIMTVRKGGVFPLAKSLNEKVLETGKGLVVHLDSAEMVAERYPSLVGSYKTGVRSTLTIPLFSKAKVIGSLAFRSKTPFAYTTDHVRLGERIANQIAGAISNARLFEELREAHNNLEERVQERTVELEEVNTALRVILRRRTDFRARMAEDLQTNVNDLIIPFLSRLRKVSTGDECLAYLDGLEANLHNIVSPFINQLSNAHKDLTPKEIQIAELVKQGKHSKEIAELLGIGVGTVVTHRHNIRRKLSLDSKGANLRSHLLSLTRDPAPSDH